MSATLFQPVILLACVSGSHCDKRQTQLERTRKALSRLFNQSRAPRFFLPVVSQDKPGQNAVDSWYSPLSREQITVLHLESPDPGTTSSVSTQTGQNLWLQRAGDLSHLKMVLLEPGASQSQLAAWLQKDIPAVVIPGKPDDPAISYFYSRLAEGHALMEAAHDTAFKYPEFGVQPVRYDLEEDGFVSREGLLGKDLPAKVGIYYFPEHRQLLEEAHRDFPSAGSDEQPTKGAGDVLQYVAPRILAGVLGFGWGVGLIALYHYLQDPEAFQQMLAMLTN